MSSREKSHRRRHSNSSCESDYHKKKIEVEKYKEPYIKVQLIFEEKDYITEIMYVEVPEGQEDNYILNEFANLLNINEDKIYGNVIINRSYVSSTNNDMHLDNITSDKLLNSSIRSKIF